jgi:hypothetical protein
VVKLKSSVRTSYGRIRDLVNCYGVSASQMKVSFLTTPHCQFRGVEQGKTQTYLYLLFQAQWDICDQQNHQTWNYFVKGHHRWHSYGYQLCFLFADLFIYSYEANLYRRYSRKTKKMLARSFNFMFRYIDDVLSQSNSKKKHQYPYEVNH